MIHSIDFCIKNITCFQRHFFSIFESLILSSSTRKECAVDRGRKFQNIWKTIEFFFFFSSVSSHLLFPLLFLRLLDPTLLRKRHTTRKQPNKQTTHTPTHAHQHTHQTSTMREIVHVQGGQCGNQIGAKFWEVISDAHCWCLMSVCWCVSCLLVWLFPCGVSFT